MAKTKKIQTNPEAARRVVMVVHEDAYTLDVVGPLEVLMCTRLFLEDDAMSYDVDVVAHASGAVRTASGIVLQADKSFAEATVETNPIDTLIIAGGPHAVDAADDKDLIAFVKAAAPKARRVVSICTGALILAAAGLLENRRATTHWWWCPILKQKYPNVQVDADAIFVRDGNIWTSAGVTTGMDLALALVETDFGHEMALNVARLNVMYMMRPGGQSQFSAHLVAQKAEDPVINETLEYVLGHLTEPLTVTALAARAAMSERTFARKFKDETGITPAHYVEAARIQKARVELEQSDTGIEQIAIKTGFQNAERMRRAFQRHVGVSASDYRDRFQPVASSMFQIPEGGE
ncbi:MAG: DJ-1/PfpI family protein [Hyphomonas sp.]|nr:DJ-1/PfpI family protein [Hyphomonas sp.]